MKVDIVIADMELNSFAAKWLASVPASKREEFAEDLNAVVESLKTLVLAVAAR